MNKLGFVIVSVLFLISPCWAGYETLQPDGVVSGFNQWLNTIDGWTELTDDNDATTILGYTVDTQRVTNGNLSIAEGNDKIDSVRLVWRAKREDVASDARASIYINTDFLNGSLR